MTTLPKKIEKAFDLFWGFAPLDSLKGRKGEAIKQFFAEHMISKEEVKEKIEKIRDEHACLLVFPESEIPKMEIFNRGAQRALEDLEKELNIE